MPMIHISLESTDHQFHLAWSRTRLYGESTPIAHIILVSLTLIVDVNVALRFVGVEEVFQVPDLKRPSTVYIVGGCWPKRLLAEFSLDILESSD